MLRSTEFGVVRNRSSGDRFSQLDGPDGLEGTIDQEPETDESDVQGDEAVNVEADNVEADNGRAAVQKCSVSGWALCCCKGIDQRDCSSCRLLQRDCGCKPAEASKETR